MVDFGRKSPLNLILVDDGAEQEEQVSGRCQDEVGDDHPEEDRGRAEVLAGVAVALSPGQDYESSCFFYDRMT